MTKNCVVAALAAKSGVARSDCARLLDMLAGRAKKELRRRGEFKIPGVCVIKKTNMTKDVRKATKPVCVIKKTDKSKGVQKTPKSLLAKGLRVAAKPGKIVVQALPALTVPRQTTRRRAVGAQTSLAKSRRVPLKQHR